MKLNVNFSALRIEAAKMNGLEGLVNELRNQKVAFNQGLDIASAYTRECGGAVEEQNEGVVRLTVSGFSVDCFQPYSDIDVFYFEY